MIEDIFDWMIVKLFFPFVFLVLVGLLIFLAAMGFTYVRREIGFRKAAVKEIKCSLLNQQFNASTLQSHLVTTIGAKGQVMVGSVMTGHGEEFVTRWECEGVGNIVKDDEDVFRRSKFITHLWIKEYMGKVRVIGFSEEK